LRLSQKLTLALSLNALVVFAALGAWQLRSEEEDLRSAAERDARLLGRSLQVAFENALRDSQGEDVIETLRELERSEPEVDLFVYDASGRLVAASTGARPRTSARVSSPSAVQVTFIPESESHTLELAAPLHVATESQTSTLILARPLDEMRRDLQATRTRVVFAVLSFVLAVAGLTMLLSRFWVALPLEQMINRMRRVRAGDLSSTFTSTRSDEVGDALREFDVLVRELAEARHRLESEIEHRRRLEDGMRRLDKLVTVGQLAAGLAHEIGSPLQVLAGRIRALERNADRPDEARRIAGILLEQTERITRIVSRLSGVLRRAPLRFEPTDVAKATRTVIELMEGEARRRRISLRLVTEADLPSTSSDGDQIQQLVLNLIRNALEASEPGGTIDVTVSEVSPGQESARVQAGVQISVEDHGRGMDKATVARASEAFFTTREDEGGTGLGLAVVKDIVDKHRGVLTIHSALGVGTRVDVLLPLSERDADSNRVRGST
jgi:signal transduction histidine kinase